MKFLFDVGENDSCRESELCGGQLLTPLTKYRRWSDTFAIDNGAYTRFDRTAFRALLKRQHENKTQCLWVAIPDVPFNGRRTLEIFARRNEILSSGWNTALVAQDGIEDCDIPWLDMKALFIGGSDQFKNSQACLDLIRTAQILNLLVHIGRINSPGRYKRFADIGCDTCDGSGVCRFTHRLREFEHAVTNDQQLDLLE